MTVDIKVGKQRRGRNDSAGNRGRFRNGEHYRLLMRSCQRALKAWRGLQ